MLIPHLIPQVSLMNKKKMIDDARETKDIFLSNNKSIDKVDETMAQIEKEQKILKRKLKNITKKIDENAMNNLTSREKNKLLIEKAQAINNGILAAEKVYDLYFAEAHTQAKIVSEITDKIVEDTDSW